MGGETLLAGSAAAAVVAIATALGGFYVQAQGEQAIVASIHAPDG
jgi:anti-sigma-K factor RskA